jgi:protein SCO1/2
MSSNPATAPNDPPKSGRAGVVGLALALVCLAGAGGAFWYATRLPPPAPSLPAQRPLEGHEMRFGPIRPGRPMPAVTVTLEDGSQTTLPELVKGKWTMMQLMFTSCSTTCPIQGAIFERTQALTALDPDKLVLLSLSIDPIGDSPAGMKTWLQSFEAGPNWRGAIPDFAGMSQVALALNGTGDGVDVHDARVYFISPAGELVYATEDMPSPEVLDSLAREALAGPPSDS